VVVNRKAIVWAGLLLPALFWQRGRNVQAQPNASSAPPSGVQAELVFEKSVLPNGLEVILHEDHRTPVVAVNVWYHVGSKDEAPGKNGFAHLFEHLMFQGSKHVGEDMFFKYLERAGSSERNGTTNSDRTNYFETVPANELTLALWLESDRMGFLLDHAGEETFRSQREVVKNERRQNYENAPYGLVPQYIHGALYPKEHPYHRLTIGTPADLDAASMDDVRGFFRTFYVPNNASLVVAGDIDRAKTKALVEQYFGPIARGAEPPVKKTPIPVRLAKEKTLRVEAAVELPRLYITWLSPPMFAPGDADLDVLSDVLTSGQSSRLSKRLVYDLQIAQDVSAYQASAQLGSQFEIMVTGKKGQSPSALLALVDEELDRLRREAPSEEEVSRSRTGLLSKLVFRTERVTERANLLNTCNQMTGTPGCLSKDVARYQAVRPADVQRAVQTYLPPKQRVVTFALPTPHAPRAGRLVETR